MHDKIQYSVILDDSAQRAVLLFVEEPSDSSTTQTVQKKTKDRSAFMSLDAQPNNRCSRKEINHTPHGIDVFHPKIQQTC